MKTEPLSFEELTTGITSFEDVVAKCGDKVEDILPHADPQTVRQKVNNDNARLEYIAEYLKQGQRGYYCPWFWNNKDTSTSSGFRLSYCVYGYVTTYSGVGSRLWMPTRQLGVFFGKQFIEIHDRLINSNY